MWITLDVIVETEILSFSQMISQNLWCPHFQKWQIDQAFWWIKNCIWEKTWCEKPASKVRKASRGKPKIFQEPRFNMVGLRDHAGGKAERKRPLGRWQLTGPSGGGLDGWFRRGACARWGWAHGRLRESEHLKRTFSLLVIHQILVRRYKENFTEVTYFDYIPLKNFSFQSPP